MRLILDQLALCKGAKFASFKYRSKGTNVVSRYNVTLGIDLTALYRRDKLAVLNAIPSLSGIDLDAANEIVKSLDNSLDNGVGNNDAYTHGKNAGDTYLPTDIPNVSISKNDGSLHLKNVIVRSSVIIDDSQRIVKKPVNSKPLTIAKDNLKKSLDLGIGKIIQFKLEGISIAKLNGETIEIE